MVLMCAALLLALSAVQGESLWVSHALAEGMLDFAPSSQTDPECTHGSQLYLQALHNSTLWAVQMLDASSVTVGGLLTGDMYSLGHYDQCVSVQVPLKAQYCLATLQYGPTLQAFPPYYAPPVPTAMLRHSSTSIVWDKVKMTLDPGITRRDLFHWALCVPASCRPQDVQQSLNTTLASVFSKHNLSATVTVDPALCTTFQQDPPATTGYVVIMTFLYVVIAVNVLAAMYDCIISYFGKCNAEQAHFEEIVMSFSLRKNIKRLLEKGANPKIDPFNGGKVVSIMTIMFGHRAMHSHGLALYNNEFWELKQDHSYGDLALTNATYLVEFFFFSSAFLSFLGIRQALEKRQKLDFFLILFLRWIRIVPAYLTMMGIVGWLLPRMSDGPLWNKRIGLESQRCHDNWWLNLLFINNYINDGNQCLLLSWYLACDMQLFTVGVCAIYVLWRWPRAGYAFLALLLTASILIPFYITYRYRHIGILRLYGSTLFSDPFKNNNFVTMYVKTHNRAGPYIIGIISACIATKMEAANKTFTKKTTVIGTVVLFGGGWLFQSYCYFFYQRDHPYMALEHALYAALHRTVYSIGIAWCTVAYYTSQFEPLMQMLSSASIFTPLSRLVYGLVLVHPSVQLAVSASARHSDHMQYTKMFWMTCGDFLTSCLLALLMYLMVEAPGRNLVKLIFNGTTKPPSPQLRFTKEQAVVVEN